MVFFEVSDTICFPGSCPLSTGWFIKSSFSHQEVEDTNSLPQATPLFSLKTTGWWFGTWIFRLSIHSVGNVIIPTDELIFFRGVVLPPTRTIVCNTPGFHEGDGTEFSGNTSSNLESAGTKFHLTDPKSATNPLIVLISLPNGSIIKYQMEKYRYHWYSFMIDSPIYGPLDNSIIYHYFSPCITEVLICCWTCAKPLILMLVQVIANKSGEDVWAPELYRGPYGFHNWGYPTISYDLGVPPFQWNVHIGNLPKPFMTIWGTSTMAGESFFQDKNLSCCFAKSEQSMTA